MHYGSAHCNSKGDFSHTATGLLGNKRQTMLRNPLHIRSDLARSVSRGHNVPEQSVFGAPTRQTGVGVREIMGGWQSISLPVTRRQMENERDFVEMNRQAAMNGCVTTDELAAFKGSHDIRKVDKHIKKCSTKVRRIPPNMVFGLPTRPSTPIYNLLEHKYQDSWIQQQSALNCERKKEQQTVRQRIDQPYQTRTSLLRVHQPHVDEKPLWKLPKFERNAKPHLSTFRSKSECALADRYRDLDKVGREGMDGQGVYVQPRF